ncbi:MULTISPECIES: hypothetical protein [Sphingobacterium]|jgi:uncharacterized protein YdaT|uniref:Uncharacterized protein n=1 Tax=Sphingobacterium kitahiroshimense TaxID=470446 RepID=A0ABV0BZ28_9SPHI|nr:hypothetical protein [Sphingobacterium sp. IITKGP-BTPF85]KKX52177.1 hypothetical protein L950_0201365 [Sphingobacterium sp. IITKGP-BTPF85]
MPWYNDDYPPTYKNLPVHVRIKAIEMADTLLQEGLPEDTAIAIGLKLAKEHFAKLEEDDAISKLADAHNGPIDTKNSL